ncbi:MAG: adenylyltransferase/cytidyltransferase family protein, partial [Lachnospiraceae bacterium]|nr:adenylyltransferase/cytidyltransferase family protein [Lachnospiraceae bacterium]
GEEIRLGGPGPKKYKVGMYGGKFLPFHKGHRYCVETAVRECEKVYVILFHGGVDEEQIRKETPELWLSVEERTAQMKRICEDCGSMAEVIPALIDTSDLRNPDGTDDWDAETPLVRALVGGQLDAVYSSEESYGTYFNRAYPEAVHRLVDVKRVRYPISGTELRRMESEEERRTWMV